MSALRSEADIKLNLPKRSANDPKRTSVKSQPPVQKHVKFSGDSRRAGSQVSYQTCSMVVRGLTHLLYLLDDFFLNVETAYVA